MQNITLPHPTAAYQYASDVVEGRINAGKYVRLACARFLADLERQDLYFDQRVAERVCRFYEGLPHVKDYWGQRGMRFRLEPWQQFIECQVFGWYWEKGGQRRYLDSYEETPRKNGKSFRMAARGLYTLCADDVFGAEVYAGATSEKQAWECFGPMRLMAQRSEFLRDWARITVNAKSLSIATTGSKAEPVIGSPGDGMSPSHSIVDELHEHTSSALLDTMITGMGARAMHGSPLISQITTAGVNFAGPCYEKRRVVAKVLEGEIEDDTMFGVIYSIDDDDDWSDEESLVKANPNYGVSVSPKFLLGELKKARRTATVQNSFRTKHLNQWVGAKTAWMNMLAWQRQKKKLDLKDFVGLPCTIGVDLASKRDVAAIALLFHENNAYQAFFNFYAPESAAEDNDKYREYASGGDLELTPGNMTDYGYIEEKLRELSASFLVKGIAFDPWQANYLMQRLQDSGLPVVTYGQTVRNLSDPMKEVDARIANGELFHDGNKAMTWMMGNVVARVDAKDHVTPRKENDSDPRCKIDGPIALIMAMGLWLQDNQRTSYLEMRGIEYL